MSRGRLARFVVGLVGCAALFCEPSVAHQAVDPAILRLIKPRTGPRPANIERRPGTKLVEEGRRLFFEETFGGNGRTCGTCHPASNNFTIDPPFVQRLHKIRPHDPLFVAEFVPLLAKLENPKLMLQRALILENVDGFTRPGVLRGVPHTLGLPVSITSDDGGGGARKPLPFGNATGWSGDGASGKGSLNEFALGAVVQHFTKRLERVAGTDFRVPEQDELDAMEAFQLSLGRQQELTRELSSFADASVVVFSDTAVEDGRKLFHSAPARDGKPRSCAFCHAGAGANDSSGNNRLFATGVNLAAKAPFRLDSTVPVDGGCGFRSVDPGHADVICDPDTPTGDRGNETFNTASLVEAADTPPFFHNNSSDTIEQAVNFYTLDAFNNSPAGAKRAFNLTEDQVNRIGAFLRAINAVDNIDNAQRSLAGASGRPSLLRLLRDPAVVDINDAARVLSNGPLRLFVGASPVPWLRAAVLNIGRGRISEALVNLTTARGLIVKQGPTP